MPHVIVKLLSGRSEEQKTRIAEEVTKAIMATANCGESAVSVRIQDIEPEAWTETVYKPEILAGPGACQESCVRGMVRGSSCGRWVPAFAHRRRQLRLRGGGAAAQAGDKVLTAAIGPDGSFSGRLSPLTGHSSWATVKLSGRITGNQMMADRQGRLCSWHFALSKSSA